MEKTYLAYIRVSTKKQGDGASLPEQRAAIEAYAAAHKLPITEWFCELKTAAKAGRREFDTLLGLLKAGDAAGVIIHKIDRGARNGRDWVELEELVDRGVDVRFVHDNLDLTTRSGRLAANLQAVIAQDFIRNNREVVRMCMRGWLKQGYYPWPAPVGYLNRGKHQLKTIDPIKGPMVMRAFELYAGGGHSLDTLRIELARLGLRGRDGAPLKASSVSHMLRNPFYMVLIHTPKTGEMFEGKHAPLVTASVFSRVQAVLDGRVFPRDAQHEFQFRRLIRCGACPRTLTAEVQKGHVYYRCHTPSCRGAVVRERALNALIVVPKLEHLRFDDGEMREVRDIVTEAQALDESAETTRIETIERDLQNLDERLKRLTDALVDGLLDQAAFAERRGGLLHERKRLTEARDSAQPSLFWRQLLNRFELGNAASTLYISANAAERRDLLTSLGSNLIAHGNDVGFTLSFPFEDIANAKSLSLGAPCRGQVRTRRLSRAQIKALILTLRENCGDYLEGDAD